MASGRTRSAAARRRPRNSTCSSNSLAAFSQPRSAYVQKPCALLLTKAMRGLPLPRAQPLSNRAVKIMTPQARNKLRMESLDQKADQGAVKFLENSVKIGGSKRIVLHFSGA